MPKRSNTDVTSGAATIKGISLDRFPAYKNKFEHLKGLGFSKSLSESTVYVKRIGAEILIVL